MSLRKLLIVVPIVYFSCTNNTDEIKSSVTIIVDSNLLTGDPEELYFFISNDQGDVLDTKKVEANNETKLSTNAALDHVSLTLCRMNKTAIQENHVFSTFLNIPTNGEPINFIKGKFTLGIPVGSAKISIENYTSSANSIVFSNGHDKYTALNTFISSKVLTGTTLITEITLLEDNSEIVICATKSSDPVYLKLTGVKPNDDISVNFNDFLNYSEKIDLNLTTQSSSSLMGFKNGSTERGHFLFVRSNVLSLPYLGYLNGYDSYYSALTSITSNGAISYEKLGSLPSAINFTQPSLTVFAQEINNFNFSLSESYTYRVSIWSHLDTSSPNVNTFDWFVRGDTGQQKLSIPQELLDKYSFLQMDKLEYKSTRVIKCVDCSYESFVKEFFSTQRENHEFYEYTFIP